MTEEQKDIYDIYEYQASLSQKLNNEKFDYYGSYFESMSGIQFQLSTLFADWQVRNEKDVEMCRELAEALGGQLAFTRPMVENGFGDTAHQIGLSGRTVRPKLIITCGVSGAIQFTSCMNGSECIVAINTDPQAQIFGVADYCIVDDLYQVVPELTALAKKQKED